MNRVVGSDNERANINITTHINISYSLSIATMLVGGRPTTVFCMVAVDALMQLDMTSLVCSEGKIAASADN